MVKQGDIIKLNFNPQSGHEQSGYRPALVVSNDTFNAKTNLAICCPITNTTRPFPLRVELDARTKTTGTILCDHIKSLDINARKYDFVERLPTDLLDRVIGIINAQIEKI